jgi:EAL domain-containing protein (putative c-di-GMP-specific phosphodiesterase class I)
LTLEITESVLVDDPAVAQSRLQALRDVGVRVSIDDFGKGYSSLSYLARFPLDQIKIDQVFVDSLDTSQSNRSIVASMIELAHTLELQVVAEGVERTSQLELLAELGCDVIQGYVVSPAVPPPAAAMWAERGSWRPPRGRWRASTPERLIGPERLSAPKVER